MAEQKDCSCYVTITNNTDEDLRLRNSCVFDKRGVFDQRVVWKQGQPPSIIEARTNGWVFLRNGKVDGGTAGSVEYAVTLLGKSESIMLGFSSPGIPGAANETWMRLSNTDKLKVEVKPYDDSANPFKVEFVVSLNGNN